MHAVLESAPSCAFIGTFQTNRMVATRVLTAFVGWRAGNTPKRKTARMAMKIPSLNFPEKVRIG